MSRSCVVPLALASLALSACAHARAADRYRTDAIAQYASRGLPPVDDAEAQRRVADIQRLLDAQQRPTRIWRYGWIGGYSVLALGSVGRSAISGRTELPAGLVGFAASTLGLVSVIFNDEHSAHAADDLHGYLTRTHDPWSLRLRVAEEALRACARDEAFTFSWPAQLARVLVAVSSWAAITYAAGQAREGAVNLGVSLAVGQVSAYTHPTGMVAAWNRYVARHPDVEHRHVPFSAESPLRWAVVPAPTGPQFVVAF